MKWKAVCFLAIVLFLLTSPCGAKEFQFYHGDTRLSLVGIAPSETDHMSWTYVGYIPKTYDVSGLTLIPSMALGVIHSNIATSPSVEGRIELAKVWRRVYMRFGGGFAYLFNPNDMPEIADSWIYGLITMEIGLRFPLERERLWTISFVQNHISSPIHGDDDPGINVGGLQLSFSF